MTSDIPTKQAKLLALVSGGRCAFPACRIELWVDNGEGIPSGVLGEMAHIRGEKPTSARYDPTMTPAERNAFPNLVYLCPNHHTEIDTNCADWPVERLIQLKRDHESWVQGALGDAMAAVTFAELDVITKAVALGLGDVPTDFTVVDPASKMRRNDLTSAVAVLLKVGLANANVVTAYLAQFSEVDAFIVERLKAGFKAEYERRIAEGLSGDALFEVMHEFATSGVRGFKQQAAGLAVLAYLFDTCEVFER